MNILDFPLDIWGLIIQRGSLAIPDVLNLLTLNKLLHQLLRHNAIWYRIIYDRYLKIQLQYDIRSAKDLVENRNDVTSHVYYYELAMRFYKKELVLENWLQYDTDDIRKYIDAFVDDDDYLPICYNSYFNNNNYLAKLDTLVDISLVQRSYCLNVLIAHAYRLGFNYFNQLSNSPSPSPSPINFEEFWFKISLLDKSCHSIIFARQIVLTRIYHKLHQEINIKQFFNKNGNILLIPKNKPSGKDCLVFKDNNVLIQLIMQIFRLTLSCLKFDNPLISKNDAIVYDKYCQAYYLEDFSILRLYSGDVKGHPFLIMSILMKVTYEFLFLKYIIKFAGSNEIQNIPINMTSTYLRVDKYLFSFDRKLLTSFSGFQVYTINEVVHNLRENSYFEISKFIEPLDFKSIVDCYLHLDYFLEVKSLNTILRPDYYFHNHDNVAIDLSLFDHKDLSMITVQDYSFIKLICRYIQDKNSDNNLLDSIFFKDFEKSLNYLNNFIHFSTIFRLFEENDIKKSRIKNYFLQNFTSETSILTTNFDLFDSDSKISFNHINAKYPFINNRDSDDNFKSGQIIRHNKFDTYGIVLGRVVTSNTNNEFYRVLTTSKSIECYNGSSMTIIDWQVTNVKQIINFVLRSCGEDIVGMLYFRKLSIKSSYISFV